ncbi:MAG: DUF2490 domain-containing protein [Flavobacteriaceae bacterium]
MIISFIKKAVCFSGLFCLHSLLAQENLTIYLQPQVALNYKVTASYSHNFSLIQRSYLFEEQQFRFRARQVDFGHFSDFKIQDNQSFSFGILYRFRENFETSKENELRLIQQYNITFNPRTVRFGHRFRAEQRITPSLTTHRFRYRFAVDFPLQGEQLDLGEAYLVVSTESLLSIAVNNLPQYDQRFTGEIGWLLAEKTRLQVGMEYRFEDYTHKTENVLFFLTSLVLSL